MICYANPVEATGNTEMLFASHEIQLLNVVTAYEGLLKLFCQISHF